MNLLNEWMLEAITNKLEELKGEDLKVYACDLGYQLFENENNTTYRFVYNKLDSNKNWTELIEYENEIPVKITERTIEYY